MVNFINEKKMWKTIWFINTSFIEIKKKKQFKMIVYCIHNTRYLERVRGLGPMEI